MDFVAGQGSPHLHGSADVEQVADALAVRFQAQLQK
jgi:hypothetical protein